MRVGIERDADLRVSQPLLNDLGMYVVLQQQSRARMPQIMEADVRQVSLFQKRLEAPFVKVASPPPAAALVRENERVTFQLHIRNFIFFREFLIRRPPSRFPNKTLNV
jgi:hypothetical protein